MGSVSGTASSLATLTSVDCLVVAVGETGETGVSVGCDAIFAGSVVAAAGVGAGAGVAVVLVGAAGASVAAPSVDLLLSFSFSLSLRMVENLFSMA